LKLADFELVMLLPAMSLGLRFCTSRKGGKGQSTWRVKTAWLLLGLAVERPCLPLGGPILSTQTGLENKLLALWGVHFWQWSFFSQSGQVVIGCKLTI